MRGRLFDDIFPTCKLYGMTEEEFWEANPRKIKAYEKAFKEKLEWENKLNYLHGAYEYHVAMSAASALASSFSKKHRYTGSYIEEPFTLFEPTVAEKKESEEELLKRFEQQLNRFQTQFNIRRTQERIDGSTRY